MTYLAVVVVVVVCAAVVDDEVVIIVVVLYFEVVGVFASDRGIVINSDEGTLLVKILFGTTIYKIDYVTATNQVNTFKVIKT